MNSERAQSIIRQANLLYPDFLSIETEYNLNIRNKVGSLKSTTNVFRKKLPENIILLRLAYDISLIKTMTTNFINNINDDINNYDFDPSSNFSLIFKIRNNNISVVSQNVQNNSNIDTALAYKEFFEALKRYLVALSLEGEYTELKRINDYIDQMDGIGVDDFYNFIDYNFDLYSQFIPNTIKREENVTVQNTSIPAFADFKNYQSPSSNSSNNSTYSSYNVVDNGYNLSNTYPSTENYYNLPNNGLCVTSLVLGIVSILLWFFVVIPLLAVIFGIIGLSTFDNKRQKNKSFGYAGLILGLFFLFLDIFLIFLPILFSISG